jgi:hypothetical protein
MLIYNKTWYTNLLLIEKVQQKADEGCISAEEVFNIKASYPIGFYTPGLIGRIGMFILTIFISIAASGLLSLMFASSGFIESYGWFLFLGILHYVLLEIMVGINFHFRSGVDDALLWTAFGSIAGCIFWALEKQQDVALYTAGFVFIFGCLITSRFNDRLIAGISYLAAYAFVYFAWQKVGSLGLLTMPFILMLFSAASYWYFKKRSANPGNYFYDKVFSALQMLSLLTFYLSGNFYAVKELNDLLQGTESKTIPFAFVFWVWTILLPGVYIAFGIISKKHLLLRMGILLVVVAAFTFRNYHHLMPLENVLSLSGVGLLACCWWLHRFLRVPKYGFSLEEKPTSSELDFIKIESLIIAGTESSLSSGLRPSTAASKTSFGGGSFGGGGAGSDF